MYGAFSTYKSIVIIGRDAMNYDITEIQDWNPRYLMDQVRLYILSFTYIGSA